jgi:hypothetical protein
MSRNLDRNNDTPRTQYTEFSGGVTRDVPIRLRSSILASVHAFYCANPLCSKTVSPTREWQRYCSAECRQRASLIKRVGNLYGLEIAVVHDALTRVRK